MNRKSISAIWIAVLLIGAVLSGCVEKEPEVQDGIERTHYDNEIGYTQKKSGLKLVIEQTTGEYRVEYQGGPWLAGGQVRFYANGQWFTSNPEDNKTQPLTLMEIDEGKGSDRLGDYKAIKIKWQLSNRKKAPVDTLFYLYHDQPLITFEQTFSEAIPNTSVGDFETAITAFPCFSTEKGESSSLGYIAWGGIWHPMVKGKGLRDFTDELCRSTLQDCDPGAEGFPLVLYDENLNALVLSPLNNFMIGVQSTKPEGDLFSCGVEGEIKSIPEGFSYRTVLYAGKGINQALYEWGDTLLRWHGKKRTDPYADVGLSYLQYWTDNGAYYYYNTEKGKNYEETLLDVKSYLDEIGLPVRSFQLDSWWYFKEGEWALSP
ncbi:MAG TPA: hypothetical protein HA348_00015, partial [Thermoplasmata archaeon]|nr:hypothetical protein [Thermoplasmata archaeon]